MKKIILIVLTVYIILGIIFYTQSLKYLRSVVSIGGTTQKIDLTKELPTSITMIFLWPFLLLGQAMNP
jgi:hypothetical protein